ncbi:hypothetical protein J7337_007787 [Fusarium musae]|uniref:Uncharacterized protein n=1 Tax=Fusarium musae TaxID=1042133 RepID=A0A9P8IP42_9HYPO|nr:hypothetical protein J7337_007787 [Fusarium musae]KAG9502071.1 hypothetical protein J7337_007787 [Fusarium musae]
MSDEPYLNAVTVLERFMPYELGRQLQRFHDDHPGSLPMLTDKDWEWIRDVCTKPPTQPGEERYPAEFGYRRRFKRNKNQDSRLKPDDNLEPEGHKSRQDETTEMNQDAGSEVAREADSEQEGVGQ